VKEADLKQIEAVQVARRSEGNFAAASKLRQSKASAAPPSDFKLQRDPDGSRRELAP